MPKVKVHFSTHERELLGSVSEGVPSGINVIEAFDYYLMTRKYFGGIH